ncbi:GNAT family N-acetyltransferase [Maribius pontilimi]|uniref:GNAT family N-acetyltransferase n=1 Tax=Palleronia pontilimi TaxID=1964209 RepID=A0A934I742_9RHOB|nr:GNAT family N-acetyltransferase [Palleronia pontilimi]MBJ3761438.1 GNAT family N-acetyltransferase [Palleronia pontilimi]
MLDFDPQPVLTGERLSLRPLRASDRDGLYHAASDPLVWEQHPASTRHQRDVFDPYFDELLASKGTLCVRTDGTVIGCSRYYPVPAHPGEWGIGYTFLDRAHWGGAWNREMKTLMLRHAFASLPRVWFHIAQDNLRSQIATTRLGAEYQYDEALDMGVPMKAYTLTPDQWRAATGIDLMEDTA